jgi:hypothetical protein
VRRSAHPLGQQLDIARFLQEQRDEDRLGDALLHGDDVVVAQQRRVVRTERARQRLPVLERHDEVGRLGEDRQPFDEVAALMPDWQERAAGRAKRHRVGRMAMHDARHIRTGAHGLGMDEDLVVDGAFARHLAPVKGDLDEVGQCDLVEPQCRGLHVEPVGPARHAAGHVTPDDVALALHRQDAAGGGKPLFGRQALLHRPRLAFARVATLRVGRRLGP